MLELKKIVKDYQVGKDNVVHALKDINLKFGKTGLVAILGQSGCGKTTMLNILGGLDRYTYGDLIVDGISTKNFTDKDWDNYRNKKVGMIFQSYNLIQHMTVAGNVELAMSLSGVDIQAKKNIAKQALIRVGLEKEMNKLPNQLSGGQQQRVAIARALVNNPSIILADEPTGALDTNTSIQIMELLEEISTSKLIIMVTHNQELAYKYATRIIQMSDGKVVKDSKNKPEKELPKSKKKNPIKEELAKAKKVKKEKSSMSILTSIGISVKNLLTKKGRTIMTSVAGSFGIIGIALILAVSNGLSMFIKNMQEETLASYPVSVDETYLDTTGNSSSTNLVDYPTDENVNVVRSSYSYHVNNITDEYIDYVNKMDSKYTSAVQFNYALQTNVVFKNENDSTYSYLTTTQKSLLNSLTSTTVWNQLPSNTDFISEKYDLIKGHYPTNSNELILVVNKKNGLTESTLKSLGFSTKNSTISFDNILNKTYKMVPNDKFYTKESTPKSITGRFIKSNEELSKNGLSASQFYSTIINYLTEMSASTQQDSDISKYEEMLNKWDSLINQYFDESTTKEIYSYKSPVVSNDASTTSKNLKTLYEDSSLKELKIVGIIRPKDSNVVNYLSSGVYYSSSLIEETISEASSTEMAKDAANHLVIKDGVGIMSDFSSTASTTTGYEENYYYFPQVYSMFDSDKDGYADPLINYKSILTESDLYTTIENIIKNNPMAFINALNYLKNGEYQKALDILSKYSSGIETETLETMLKSTITSLASSISTALNTYMTNRKAIGTDKKVSSITIYPRTFDDKSKVLAYLDKYNENKDTSSQIKYTDLAGTVFSAVETMVNIITIVLICFSSVSLVVSSVMIGIIMYSSVIERTKEIGILRSIGARKIDISRLFKTEAVIIGFLAGLVGIIITYIIQVPLNLILENVIEGVKITNLASLNPWHAIMLILISMFLTYFSALIPARFAAKKDPVKSLRSSD